MEKAKLFLFNLFFVLLIGIQVQANSHHHHHHHHRQQKQQLRKLFVFGDSYADTGNFRKSLSSSWKEPYGITFPGKPSGRFSDGRVLTDYLASIVGIRSPIPYRWKNMGPKALRYGMNFAYGGTGVFDTLISQPNMTTQIDFFQKLVNEGVYSKFDLQSAIALVSVAGNDYGAYQARNGTLQGLQSFVKSLVDQLALNLYRIHDIGVRKITVTGLEPLGCLPSNTAIDSHQQCNQTVNAAANFHNLLLEKAVEEMKKQEQGSTFVILDLYRAFMSVFQTHGSQGKWKFENPLKPCCEGISNEYSCGSTDESGNKKYRVCENRDSFFFWDGNHPSQAGWVAVTDYLQTSLHSLS